MSLTSYFRQWRQVSDVVRAKIKNWQKQSVKSISHNKNNLLNTTITVLRPFFRDHPGEPVPEENFWTLWCKRRQTAADTQTIRLGATPSGLISAHLHHPPTFYRPDAFRAAQPTVSKHWRQLVQLTGAQNIYFNMLTARPFSSRALHQSKRPTVAPAEGLLQRWCTVTLQLTDSLRSILISGSECA